VAVSLNQPSRPPLDAQLPAELSPPWTVEVLDRSPSTNAVVAERARAGESEGLVVVAEHQTAGRGRLDRTWETPERAALTFSVLLRPAVPDRSWPWLPLLAGLAVADGIIAAGGPPCELKWPNDVMYDGLKLAGLLVERVDTTHGPAAVLGIGLNVTTLRHELPVETATSLLLTGMLTADRSRLLSEVLLALDARYVAWRDADGDASRGLAQEYQHRCDTVGREVEVQLPTGERVHGTAVGVGAGGPLVVETSTGRIELSAGDVVHVRPT
jgi:BirA family transcriptional regulator, biotin operon repressor / biotin---[acetyl-CoA-carboxylase] ligase